MIAQWGSRSRVVSAGVILFGLLVPAAGGTVKIDGVDILDGPSGVTPHQGCVFVVEFSDFDEGSELSAEVSFEDGPPTADGGLQVVSGDLSPFVGEDAAGGEGDLDAKETYTLKFTGRPDPDLGYAVEVTVNGQSKPFWVQGCTTATPPPTTPPVTKPPASPSVTPPTARPTTRPATRAPTSPITRPPATRSIAPSQTVEGTSTAPSTSSTETSTAVPVPQPSKPVAKPSLADAGFVKGSSSTVGRGAPELVSTFFAGILLTAGGVLLAGAAVLILKRGVRRGDPR